MINIRQYRVLKELKANENDDAIISKNKVLQALKDLYGDTKYTEEILNAEIKELERLGYVEHSDSVWQRLTPEGKLLVSEYCRRRALEAAKYLLFHIAIPVATSLITTLITMHIEG